MNAQTTQDTTHEGWTNYATWGVALVLDNEQATHEECRAQARAFVDSADRHDNVPAIWTAQQAAQFGMEDWIQEYVERLCERDGMPLMAQQLVAAGLAEVNWSEIAQSILDGLES